jgi:hypothetical protein
VYEFGFVTGSHIQKAIFPDKDPVTCRVRLSQLVKDGYLNRFVYDVICFKLTRKGINEILDIPVDPEHYKKLRFPRFHVTHDMELVDCSLIIRKSSLIKYWMPRSELGQYKHDIGFYMKGGYRVPDTVFDIQSTNRVIRAAFEYERTQKSARRYWRIFDNYSEKPKLDLVLYLVKSENLKNKLLDIADQTYRHESVDIRALKNKFYIATIDEFNEKKLDTVFKGLGKRIFSFNLISKKRAQLKPQQA